jgi:hypothetical protein
MGPYAVFTPQRRFRHALRHLHHILDLQRCALREGLRDQLRPTRELRACANERLARPDDTHLPPHRPAQRAPQFFNVVQRAVLFVFQGRFMCGH